MLFIFTKLEMTLNCSMKNGANILHFIKNGLINENTLPYKVKCKLVRNYFEKFNTSRIIIYLIFTLCKRIYYSCPYF